MVDRTAFTISIPTELHQFGAARASHLGISIDELLAALIDQHRAVCKSLVESAPIGRATVFIGDREVGKTPEVRSALCRQESLE